jgi:N-succinyldiaminopimelate aminotransferase
VSTTGARPALTSKLHGFGTTIFAEMSALAAATDSINLGQGFPDYEGPREVLEVAMAEISRGNNQYPPGPGAPVLRHAIAEHQARFYGLHLDPDREVFVTAGAQEALAGCLLGLLDTGDELIAFEPLFDTYQPLAAMAGATVVPVTIAPPDYHLPVDALRAAVTPRTRALLVNSPHNPTGKVLTRDELHAIADIAIEHDLLVITDEVYEHLTFDGTEHIPIASLPGMFERTLTIGSGGKTFSTTGWKTGWITGPAELVAAARIAKQNLTFVNGGPFQPAIAAGLRMGDDFFRWVAADLQAKRNRLLPGLEAAGFTVFPTSGTYFVTVDITPLRPDGDGMAFCRELPHRVGVVAIPNEALYINKAHGRHLVRFAFCKRLEVLDEAVARLTKLATS